MSKYFFPVVVACILFAGCADSDDAPMNEGPPDATELLQTDQAFAQLSADSGAVAAFSMYLAEDAIQMPAGAPPIVGRDSIIASMSDGPEFQLLWAPKDGEIAASGELGWTWGVYQAKFTNGDGNEVSSDGKYVNVWHKQDDGNWRVAIDMGNTGS